MARAERECGQQRGLQNGEGGGGGEEDLVRRRLGETKPETCTQIAQANKQAQDAGHAPSKGNQAWEQQQQCHWERGGGNDDERVDRNLGNSPRQAGRANR